MRPDVVVLVSANLVYATSAVATRVVLDDLPPATLALLRLVIGAAVLMPLARVLEPPGAALDGGDARRIVWMGLIGFAGAFAFSNWGLARSTATNAALLIIVEPVSIMALSPMLLGERMTAREGLGAVLAVLGAVAVVLNGVPGVSEAFAPHWRGDLLLVVSGVAYGVYTLLGRGVLTRHSPLRVTARSIVWGALAMVPFAAAEWLAGARLVPTPASLAGTLYLGIIITAFGYLLWNWALARVPAPQVAVFVAVQPIGGAILAVVLLHEPLTVFTVVGGLLVVVGLWLTVSGRQ